MISSPVDRATGYTQARHIQPLALLTHLWSWSVVLELLKVRLASLWLGYSYSNCKNVYYAQGLNKL